MRDEAPLYRNDQYDFWALSRFADVEAAHRDPKTFCSGHGTVLELMAAEPYPGGQMIFMDPPDHTRLRTLVSRAFTPRRVDALEDRIRELSADFLDRLAGRDSFDYVQDFAVYLPSMVISSLLGVPLRRPGDAAQADRPGVPHRAGCRHGQRRVAHGTDRDQHLHPLAARGVPCASPRRHAHRSQRGRDHRRRRRHAPAHARARPPTSPTCSSAPAPRRWRGCSGGRR